MTAPRTPVDQWFESEFRKLNAGVVARRRPLDALLGERDPALSTRDGETFALDRAALERLAAAATEEQRRSLLIPINLHASADAADEVSVRDEVAAAVLRRAEGWTAYAFREGRMWLPTSLAVELVRTYGGAVQILFL